MPRPLYQSWLEIDALADSLQKPPMASYPIVLSDGRALVSFLFRPLAKPRQKPRTVIVELSPAGVPSLWKPGIGYDAAVMFHAASNDICFGYDLTLPGKVYACMPDGAHVATLEMTLKMGSLVAPARFDTAADTIRWIDSAGVSQRGTLRSGRLAEVAPDTAPAPAAPLEARFPHTHITRGRLFVFDFDPMPRVSAYVLES